MARNPEYEPLYGAFQKFLKRCILDDRSLLWPQERAWQAPMVQQVKQRLVDNPVIDPGRSFEDKLVDQMNGASHDQWMILCDVYYVYFLPSTYITFAKKFGDISWAANQAGLTPPPADDEIWQAQRIGFTRTSLRYHYKYLQFWLMLFFAIRVKQESDARSIVNDPQRMQAVLDELLEGIESKNDRAYDMRHAMLYLAFPERYERIISTRDKERIVKAYGDRLDVKASQDLDSDIRQIREALGPEHDRDGRPFDFYDDLQSDWRDAKKIPDVGRPPVDKDLEAGEILAALKQTHNVILYGPPGTGKTYMARKAAEAFLRPQTEQTLSEPARIQRAIEDLTFYDVLALAMNEAGPSEHHSVTTILEHSIVQARYRLSPVKNPRANIWGCLQSHTSPDSTKFGVQNRGEPFLFDKDESSHWFLTEDGRAYVADTLADRLALLRPSDDKKASMEAFLEWATFHQSYAYEDFVEGLRPAQSEESPGQVLYDVVPGVFRRICSRAAADSKNNYVLVIDEINRGNIAKILGELITLLEDDKRADQRNALTITLPYSGQEFSVPKNLYVIGTMNTADRSIALLDVALRRRFAFVELRACPQLLDDLQVESQESVVCMGAVLRALNKGIRRYLDRDHEIGHSYFLMLEEVEGEERVEKLEFIWNSQIVPLLQEYFYSQPDKLAELLAPFWTDVDAPDDDYEARNREFDPSRQPPDDLITALARLAKAP